MKPIAISVPLVRGPIRLALAAALLLGAGALVAAQAPSPHSTRAPGQSPTLADVQHLAFTADLTVRHAYVAADGSPAGAAPPSVELRLSRARVHGHWQTAVSLRSAEPARVQAPNGVREVDNPFAIARMVFDETGSAPDMFDRAGRLVRMPGPADRQLLSVPGRDRSPTGADELLAHLPAAAARVAGSSGLIVATGGQPSRRADLERRLGPPAGRIRGLDRYLTRTGATTREMLVDRKTALPVQISLARNGRLVSRAAFDYEPMDGARLLRRRVLAEREIPSTAGDRLVTAVEVVRITIDSGGPQ